MVSIPGTILLFLLLCSFYRPFNAAGNASDNDYKVVCYYPSWAGERDGDFAFPPEKIDPTLCTHINYAFASLDSQTKTIKPSDPSLDIDQDYYKKAVELKKNNPNLKVLIALGGYVDSIETKYKYSDLVANSSTRKSFAENALKFLKKYGFDGLDLDWEYPACPSGECEDNSSDKENFPKLLKELRDLFDQQPEPPLLTAAVSSVKYYIDNSYDVPALAKYLDFINVMAYDFSQPGNEVTGLNAPFRDQSGKESAVTSMEYWLKQGAPAKKLVLGMPFYGISFTLKNSKNHGLGAAAKGPGQPGTVTNTEGQLAYFEICDNLNNGWKKGGDATSGPYAYYKDQWVGYDDPAMIQRKGQYIRDQGFGGAMFWDISMDDIRGTCCNTKNPLLNAINNVLFGKGTSASSMKCQ